MSIDLLGLQEATIGALSAKIARGFRFRLLETFAERMAMSMTTVCAWVGIPARTLERRRKEGALKPFESDRLLTTARIAGQALRLFEGDVDATKRWLTAPLAALGGASPMEFSSTEFGAREVEHLIGRLEHGVIT